MAPRLLHYSDVENAHDDPERLGRLAGVLQERRGPDAAVCGTGDDTGPGALPLVCEGRQALDFFEAVDPAVETFGNHDFDHGAASARDIVRESPQTWVSTNVRQGDGRFAAAAGTVPWTVVERGGERIGFTGVTDPRTASINPEADALTFTDPVPAAREAVAELHARDVDHVVLLSHCGSDDEELAAELDVDVVLGGHVHTEMVERVDGTLLTRPGVNGHVVLEVDLADRPTVTRHRVADGPLDEDLAAAVRERKDAADLTRPVATVDDPIERTETTAFRGESRVGNFVADAYRWATGADVGLQNSGGIREGDPLSGTVTVEDLVSLVPFEETVTVAELTGAELLDTFEQASGANVGFGERDWWHAHVSGAELVWDRGNAELREARVGGARVDPDATYTVATSDYLFHTDHEFPALDDHHRVERHGIQYEVLAAYARECGLDPAVEGRIRRVGAD